MIRIYHALPVAALALAACTDSAPSGQWTMQSSATAGSALVLTQNGSEALRIACRRNPADLLVTTPRLAGRRGPARLEIGDTAFKLRSAGDEPVLSATGPLTAALPLAMASGRAISVHQAGAATAAFPPPERKIAEAFASACVLPG